MNDLLNDGLMDVQEAAAFLRMGRSTIYQLMDSGKADEHSARQPPPANQANHPPVLCLILGQTPALTPD